MNRLRGKQIIVTGAAAGIGRASALLFSGEGATVYAWDIDEHSLLSLKSERPDIKARVVNILEDEQLDAALEGLEQVDVLFNCAGIVHQGTLLNTVLEDFDKSYALNVRAPFLLSQRILPKMIERQSGHIINMASVAGVTTGVVDRCAYSATKAALVGLTKSIAADYVKQGIRCNAVCPGTVNTPSLQARLNTFDDPVAAKRLFESRQPMGRLADVAEIAPLLVYLASDESSYVTGQIHVIDGGWSNQ